MCVHVHYIYELALKCHDKGCVPRYWGVKVGLTKGGWGERYMCFNLNIYIYIYMS